MDTSDFGSTIDCAGLSLLLDHSVDRQGRVDDAQLGRRGSYYFKQSKHD